MLICHLETHFMLYVYEWVSLYWMGLNTYGMSLKLCDVLCHKYLISITPYHFHTRYHSRKWQSGFYRQSSMETRDLTNTYVTSLASEVLKNLHWKCSLLKSSYLNFLSFEVQGQWKTLSPFSPPYKTLIFWPTFPKSF